MALGHTSCTTQTNSAWSTMRVLIRASTLSSASTSEVRRASAASASSSGSYVAPVRTLGRDHLAVDEAHEGVVWVHRVPARVDGGKLRALGRLGAEPREVVQRVPVHHLELEVDADLGKLL